MADFIKFFDFIHQRNSEYEIPLKALMKKDPQFDVFKFIENKGDLLTEKEIKDLMKYPRTPDKVVWAIIDAKNRYLTNDDILNLITRGSDMKETFEKISQYIDRKRIESAIEDDPSMNLIFQKGKSLSTQDLKTILKDSKTDDDRILAVVKLKGSSLDDVQVQEIIDYANDKSKIALAIINLKKELISKGDYSGMYGLFKTIEYFPQINDEKIKNRLFQLTRPENIIAFLSKYKILPRSFEMD